MRDRENDWRRGLDWEKIFFSTRLKEKRILPQFVPEIPFNHPITRVRNHGAYLLIHCDVSNAYLESR